MYSASAVRWEFSPGLMRYGRPRYLSLETAGLVEPFEQAVSQVRVLTVLFIFTYQCRPRGET